MMALQSQTMAARSCSALAGSKLRVNARAVRAAVCTKAVARDAPWCPGSDAPAHLNGSLPGARRRFADPGRDAATLAAYRGSCGLHAAAAASRGSLAGTGSRRRRRLRGRRMQISISHCYPSWSDGFAEPRPPRR